MQKIIILLMVMLSAVGVSVAMADEDGEGKAGRLFLFQKCDASLIGADYDASGCPAIPGPWAIFPGKHRQGKLEHSLWGDKFKFSFEGRGLPPETDYTLIYYPDPWPGTGLICLGSGKTTPPTIKGKKKEKEKGGKIEIHGNVDIGTSLPASYDANFTPISPSGAVGAKIWLVLSADVKCDATSQLSGWNPAAYLFEDNLINYERR